MMLMESMWMEKSWGEGATVRDLRQQRSPLQPLTKPAPHLAKEPQQGGFKGQVCFAFISISFSGSLRDGRLEPRALLEIRADSHLAKTQLEVTPGEQQHRQELALGTPGPVTRDFPYPRDVWDQCGTSTRAPTSHLQAWVAPSQS